MEVYTHTVHTVVTRLKSALKIKSDAELARLMNISPNVLSNWKTRNSMDYPTLITFCGQHNIDLTSIFSADQATVEEPAESYQQDKGVFDEMLIESYVSRIKTLEHLNEVLATSNDELNANLEKLQTKLQALQGAVKKEKSTTGKTRKG